MSTTRLLVNFSKYTTLETDRLVLKPLSINDLDDYHEYSGDEETLKYDYLPHKTLKESEEGLVTWYLSAPLGKYGLFLKSSGKLIGNINFRPETNEKVFIGYTLNKKFWKRGYATEALQKLISLSFNQSNIKQILAKVHSEDRASIALLIKLGFSLVNIESNVKHYRGYTFDELTYEKRKDN
ncbi:hypothetical protein CAC02_10670 [Streptococcus gallolyticus]|uniref:N-acetyltransferase domain-containing protein n=1 Tax=Streptococcus gallolyticus TaxID=315405 RepID=A0A368UBF4_9STRE|nr:GNAT family N-acetyltransferase [Streptococcus gallolyticus]RCW16045.1 hypothetical protein CAC02_10670 [Streptococcus gallolyticus]